MFRAVFLLSPSSIGLYVQKKAGNEIYNSRKMKVFSSQHKIQIDICSNLLGHLRLLVNKWSF